MSNGPPKPDNPPARTVVATRERVRALLGEGMSRAAIARELGLVKSTVAYHARALGKPVDGRFARRYDWSQVQVYHDAGHSARQCMEHFGFSAETWHSARRRGDLVTRPPGMPLAELLGAPRNRCHVKRRLLRLGLKENRCELCGLEHWRGEPLSLALHHVNGVGDDNRLKNLQLLCPNCHSQTENFAGRNRGRPVQSADEHVDVLATADGVGLGDRP